MEKSCILHELYGGKIVLPEPVFQELSNPCISHLKLRADILIDNKDISVKSIDLKTLAKASFVI